MLDALELIRKESAVIRAAPGSVIALMAVATIVGGSIAGSIAGLLSARELAGVRQQLEEALQEREFYQDCLDKGVLTPGCERAAKTHAAPSAPSPQAKPPASQTPRPEVPEPVDATLKSEAKPAPPRRTTSAPAPPPRSQRQEAPQPQPAPASPPAPRQPEPVFGVLHLDQSKLRIALKKATSGTKCSYYSTCYTYKVYISGKEVTKADNTDIKIQYPASYNFKIVAIPDTGEIVPTFENTCNGEFQMQDSVGFMEFVARFEAFDPKTNIYRFRDCALVSQ